MKTFVSFVAAGVSALALGAPAKPAPDRMTPVPANEVVPVADFFRPLQFRSPQINPTGTRIAAYFSTEEDRIDLMILDLVTNKPGGISAQAKTDVSGFQWLDDRRLVFSVSRDKKYAYGLFAVDAADLRENYAINAYDVTQVISAPRKNPLQPIVWLRRATTENGRDGGVVQFDATRRVTMGVAVISSDKAAATNDGGNIVTTYPSPKGGRVLTYLPDADGELGYAVTSKDDDDDAYTLHHWEKQRWEKAFDLHGLLPFTVTDKPGELLSLGRSKKGTPRGLFHVEAATGKVGDVVLQDDTYDFRPNKFHIREADGRIVGVNWTRAGLETTWFEDEYKGYQAELDKLMPGWRMRVIDMDRSGKKLLVQAIVDRHPGSYFLFDTQKPEVIAIANAAPWIDAARMRPMRMITCKTRDGVDIDAFVTVPAGVSKENPAPLVVMPHGGPWVRDDWGWDPSAQFLASRGYMVMQPNYRGSTGTAWRFSSEDKWDFKKMHEDVTDSVKAMITSGLVDPDRIAIMGGSFGAYLALCGATVEPDLYRCAIGIAGVYDWEEMVREAKGDDNTPGRYRSLVRNLGDPKVLAEKYETLSPLRHVNKIKIPIFVAHGYDDTVVSISQTKHLIRELKARHVAYQAQLKREEGHGFRYLDNEVELFTAIEAFLAKNMAKKVAAAPVPK
jgi:dipeptidyl aminopeptidase/acylaminoacyl peptidase